MKLYGDRTINGIKVTFTGLNNQNILELRKLDSYIYELQHFGSVEHQPRPPIYDTEVFELHMMMCSFLINTSINETDNMDTFIRQLYNVVAENQELQRGHNTKHTPEYMSFVYQKIFKLSGTLNDKYHDKDLLSVMASICNKIGKVLGESTKIKIKMDEGK